MESEYKLKFPVWIEGLSEYQSNHRKQKLLAYSSKCHTPIFGEPSTEKTAGNKQPPHSKCHTSSNKVANKSSTHLRSGRNRKPFVPKKKVPRKRPLINRNLHCVPPKSKDMHCFLKARPEEGANYVPTTLARYLQLLCNIDNVKPN